MALPSAMGTRKAQFALGKDHSAKNASAKMSLPSVFCRALGKGFAECRTLGKVGGTRQSWNRKKPEKMGIFTEKMDFF